MKLRSLLIFLLLSAAAFGQTNVPISQLPAASTLTGSELLWISQGGHSVRTTTQGVANLAGASTAGFGVVISGGMIRIDTTKAATQSWVAGQIAAIPNPLWSNIQSKPSSFPPSAHNHDLASILQSGATTGQVPQWNGTAWAPATISGGGGGSGTVTSFAFTNSTGVTGTVSNATTTPALSLALTKAAVGLSNVDNTSDANKPISTATQTALDGKQATLVSGTNIKTINGTSVLGSGDIIVSGTVDSSVYATHHYVNDLANGLTEVDRLLMMGQSNGLGVGKVADAPTYLNFNFNQLFNRVYIFNDRTHMYEKMQVGVNNAASWDSRYTYPFPGAASAFVTAGAELGVAQRYVLDHPNGLLFIDKQTGDGQPIGYFEKGTPFYDTLLSRRAQADAWLSARGYKAREKGVYWNQGENYAVSSGTYASHFNQFWADLLTDNIIKPYTQFAFPLLPTTSAAYNTTSNNAKIAFATSNPKAHTFTQLSEFNADQTHYNIIGQLDDGYQLYRYVFAADSMSAYDTTTSSGGGSSSFPTSGNVAYWKLDETSGNFLSTVGSFPLTRVAGATTSTGIISNAATFSAASTQYLTGSASSTLSATTSGFTITGWFNVPSGGAAIQTVLGKSGSSATGEYALYVDQAGSLLHGYFTDNGAYPGGSYEPARPITLGAWQFFAFVYNGTTVSLSINGGTPSTVAGPVTPYNGSGTFKIGFDDVLSIYPMEGKVDEVGIWNRVLTSGEITTLYNAGAGLTHP